MGKVRQLPQLFLRGSLANETMRNLTGTQKQLVDDITNRLVTHEKLRGHKSEFTHQLGVTISADYAEAAAGEQEYRVAIWRGVVQLLYHCSYTFRCEQCGEGNYISQRSKEIKFDRRYELCPVCGHCTIDKPGDTSFRTGDIIEFDKLQMMAEECRQNGRVPPTGKSCVLPVKGKPKYPDPEKILNDPDQIRQFFGTWIWNYFKQQLLENPIVHHSKRSELLVGPADYVAAEAMALALGNIKANFTYSRGDNPSNGQYYIVFDPMSVSPKELLPAMWKVFGGFGHAGNRTFDTDGLHDHLVIPDHKLDITISPKGVQIVDSKGSSPCVELNVSVSDEVGVVSTLANPNGDDDSPDAVKQLEQPDMYPDTGVPAFLEHERLNVVRNGLPDNTKQVFDIYTGGIAENDETCLIFNDDGTAKMVESRDCDGCENDTECVRCAKFGRTYGAFAEQFPDSMDANGGIPRQNAIAQFLGCTAKEVKRQQSAIKIQLLAHGISPD